MQDMEFTIENGKLYMLQTRNGKRTAQAAIKVAVDLVDEGVCTKEQAILKVETKHLMHCCIRRLFRSTQGSNSDRHRSAGIARCGLWCRFFTADEAVSAHRPARRLFSFVRKLRRRTLTAWRFPKAS